MNRLLILVSLACSNLWGLACTPPQVVLHAGNEPMGLAASGHGEAEGAPDVARISLGVEARHADSKQASQMVAEAMARVIAALQQAGVSEADIQTENLSMYFERARRPEPPARPATPGMEIQTAPKPERDGVYRVSNTVRATVRDLDRASQVVAAATAAGANQMHGIQFELDDPSGLEAQARAAAIADARRKAEELAHLLGVKLGPIVSVREGGGGGGGRPMMARAEAADMPSMPVARGTLTFHQTVEVIYALP